MRLPIVLILVAALAGCSTIRSGLGEYQKAADKGITLGTSTAAETAPPAEKHESRKELAKKAELPGGLTGDKANAAYTSEAPKP